jgi:hypothetical protein
MGGDPVWGEKFDQIHEFGVYSPKVFALIGILDSVLHISRQMQK